MRFCSWHPHAAATYIASYSYGVLRGMRAVADGIRRWRHIGSRRAQREGRCGATPSGSRGGGVALLFGSGIELYGAMVHRHADVGVAAGFKFPVSVLKQFSCQFLRLSFGLSCIRKRQTKHVLVLVITES